MEEKTKQERLALLDSTIAYYSENINRRCVMTNSEGDVKCKYSGTTIGNEESEGCAIGRLLTPELRQQLDAQCGDDVPSGVTDIWDYLPEDIKSYGKLFLASLQHLHDGNGYWDINGLSEDGVNYADDIKKRFCL